MDRIWLKLIGLMVCASILKQFVMHPLFWVIVDLVALAVAYLMLRTIPYINLQTSMLYLSIFTGLNILVSLGIINGLVGNILSLGIIGYLLWRNNSPRRNQPPRHKWHK